MMENSDDYDFIPTTNSNLASLFSSTPENLENASLIYTAPKQPVLRTQKSQTDEVNENKSCVMCAKIVYVWKMHDNKYNPIGKLGLAVIGSKTQHSYELILYKEKHNVTMRVKLDESFELTLRTDNFISFIDHSKQNWLIKFNNDDDTKAVLKEIEKLGGKVLDTTLTRPTEVAQDTKEIKNESTNDSKTNEEVDHFESKAKANILSRIAKMGQSILLPTVSSSNSSVNISDSDEESSKIINTEMSQNICEPKIQSNTSSQTSTTIMSVPVSQVQNVTYSNPIAGLPISFDPLNILLAENRTQNAEVRLNLTHISEKLNQIIKTIDSSGKPYDTSNDENILKSKVKSLELKVENLLRELQHYQEKCASMQQQLKHQDGKSNTKEENETLLTTVKEQDAKIKQLDEQNKKYAENIENLVEIVKNQKNEIEEYHKLSQHVESYESEICKLSNKVEELQLQLQECKEKENDNESIKEDVEKRVKTFKQTLKDSMNQMYNDIICNFSSDKEYSSSNIQSIVAQNIKHNTLKVMEDFQVLFRNEVDN